MNQNITAPLKNDIVRLHRDRWKDGEQLLRGEGAHHPVPPDGRKVGALAHDGGYAGAGERGSEKEPDRVAQFERFGFVRSDGVGGDGVVAYFTHG